MGVVDLHSCQTTAAGPLDSVIHTVRERHVHIPFARPIVTPNYTIDGIDSILVEIMDTDGAVGHAYLWCVRAGQVPVLIEALRALVPCVRGRRPAELGAIHAALRNDVNFLGLKGVAVFALSALDMAVHDLRCWRLGVGLGALLGRVRDSVPVYWSGLMLTEDDAGLLRETRALVDRGFQACKLRVGRNSIDADARRIQLVRDNTPPDLTLMLDAVQYYSPQEAVRAGRRFAEFDPHWLEEPVVHNGYRGLQQVVDGTNIPIASGENEYLPEGFAQVLDTGLDYLVVDLERVGGITGWCATAPLAAAGTAVLTPHVYPHVCVQLCSALQQKETWVEYMPWWDELMTYDLEVVDGEMQVPDVVGSGVDLDPDAVDRFATGPWQTL